MGGRAFPFTGKVGSHFIQGPGRVREVDSPSAFAVGAKLFFDDIDAIHDAVHNGTPNLPFPP